MLKRCARAVKITGAINRPPAHSCPGFRAARPGNFHARRLVHQSSRIGPRPGLPDPRRHPAANQQHYEVPAEFFRLVLGPHLKYSCAYWPPGVDNLADAEKAALALTAER